MMMLRKTSRTEEDLLDIFDYTSQKWGDAQAEKYMRKIDDCLTNISSDKAILRPFSDRVRYIRCEHHYIYLLMEKQPVVIAILHESMDLMAQLKKRLA